MISLTTKIEHMKEVASYRQKLQKEPKLKHLFLTNIILKTELHI